MVDHLSTYYGFADLGGTVMVLKSHVVVIVDLVLWQRILLNTTLASADTAEYTTQARNVSISRNLHLYIKLLLVILKVKLNEESFKIGP